MARVNSSFYALHAEAAAMAADVPQADISAEITTFRVFEHIFNTFRPKRKVETRTIGVTTHVTNMPGVPMARHIRAVLDDVYWKVAGKGGAAEILNINPSTLRLRMKRLGISKQTTIGTSRSR